MALVTEPVRLVVERRAAPLRERVAGWRRSGLRVGLVPTMGNLHDGHLSLVRHIRKHCDRVVVSIFVNPLQFAAGEDFDSYPRTLEEDARLLEDEHADLVFAPDVQEMYPDGGESLTHVSVDSLEHILCGEYRDGHFRGVATVVTKLFNLVDPHVAAFGEKDFQQVAVIRQLTKDLCFDIEILGVPTRREPDGLAMSSRNQYLTTQERRQAPVLHATLSWLRGALHAPGADLPALERKAWDRLVAAGFEPDYVSVRDAATLAPASADTADRVIVAAAHLGKARLIDNLRV